MKTILLVLSISIYGLIFAQKTTTIRGKIQNPTSDKVYLRNFVVKSGRIQEVVTLDSCVLKNGSFKLSTKLDSLTNLHIWDQNEFVHVYLKPSEDLFLALNTQYFDETIVFSGDGADRNNLMSQIALIMEAMTQQRNILYGKFELESNMDTLDLFNGLTKNDSAFYAFIDNEIISFPELKVHLEFIKYRNQIITGTYLKRARNKIAFSEMLRLESGGQFLDAIGIDIEGKEVNISDFFGKLMVIDFWATWCVPCKAEFPLLHELEDKYKDKVTFLGIASFCKQDDWQKMVLEEGFHNSIYLSKTNMEPLAKKYAIQTIPRYILLDAKGNIIDLDALRPSTGLENKLIELLN